MRAVRVTRTRIIRLRNDYKALMAAVETQLHEHFASLPDEQEPPPAAGGERGAQQPPADPAGATGALAEPSGLGEPFAKVNSVVSNSPAATAGLQPGDLIRNFGYVNFANHDGLKKVAECVQGNEGVSNQLDSHLPSRRLANSDFSSKMYLSRSLARGGTPNHRNCA